METAAGGETLMIPGFRDLKPIGRTPSSVVYRAVDTELGRPVAIKVLLADDPDDPARRRFRREREITANLGRHPHIVQVLGTGFTPAKLPYVVMELYERGSAADRLRAAGPFGVAEAVDIGKKISDAVAAAHRSGILHRDIKPENILLSEYGPALADFGIARTVSNLDLSQSFDQLTPRYAAPEILLGQEPTRQADIYSLGATLYTLLAGQPPFAGPPDEPLLRYQRRVLQDPVPALTRRDVPSDLRWLLDVALAKVPGQRWPSAEELRDALEGVRVDPIGGLDDTVNRPRPSTRHAGADLSGGEDGESGSPGAVAAGAAGLAPAEAAADRDLNGASTVHWARRHEEPSVEPAAGTAAPRRWWPIAAAVVSVVAVVVVVAVALAGRGNNGGGPVRVGSSVPPVTNIKVAAPTDLTAIDNGTEITLRWVDHTGGQASYVVLAVPPGQPAQVHVVPPGQASYGVGGLQPAVAYCFRVDTIVSSLSVAPADLCPRGGQLVVQPPASAP